MLIDGLIRINNGHMRGKGSVLVVQSNLMAAALDVLVREGYIRGYKISLEKKYCFEVFLTRGLLGIDLKIRSKPSSRYYIRYKQIRRMVAKRRWLGVVSTPLGVLSTKEILARELKIGGELLFEIKLNSWIRPRKFEEPGKWWKDDEDR
jgi:small subunit ribosomal protein S8